MKTLLPQIDARTDLSMIVEWIEAGSSVLDLGCGEGHLLDYLLRHKGVRGMGVDFDQDKIITCMGKGIPVIQRDLNEPLGKFESGAYDYVIVSQTIHQLAHPDRLLDDILRIGRRAIVSFPNFGHIQIRLQLLGSGRMPKSRTLPYEWYQTPNIHMATIRDFEDFCAARGIAIVERCYIVGGRYRRRLPLANFLSEGLVALIERRPA
ncbi:MAG: methionine biosynthesis protein MetW [Vicinamibacteria bacterium]|jgi:methionine biosynthesis protein MetW|nr:methionine biosynthesis protein MetW [Vicinamibacteria bacterium]